MYLFSYRRIRFVGRKSVKYSGLFDYSAAAPAETLQSLLLYLYNYPSDTGYSLLGRVIGMKSKYGW